MSPRAEDVCIEDIAHALSLICRFNGHCRGFYSVAQHSMLVSEACETRQAQRCGLMHDAAEAYVGDVVRPLKTRSHEGIEAGVMAAIAARWGFVHPFSSDVSIADNRMLATEARDLMLPAPADWGLRAEPYPDRIVPVRSQEAERMFLDRFEEVFG